MAGCGGGGSTTGGGATTATSAAHGPPDSPRGNSLAIGIEEAEPALVGPAGPRTAPVAAAREKLAALRPDYYRLRVDWAAAQPRRGQRPDWRAPQPGCYGSGPCLPWNGVRAQLDALRARQRAHPGRYRVLVTIDGAPRWASGRPAACRPHHRGARPAHGGRRGKRHAERSRHGRSPTFSRGTPVGGTPPGGVPRAAVSLPTHLGAYRRFVASLLRLGRRAGVPLRLWSAWNAPNQPNHLAPQRCRGALVSVEVYARLVRSLRHVLRRVPGGQRIVLGDTAAVPASTRTATSPIDFIAALPQRVACASPIWAEHSYVVPGEPLPVGHGQAGLERVIAALDERGCARRKVVWLTQTGTGAPRGGEPRQTSEQALTDQCEAMEAALLEWYKNPRVAAAFQYSFRQDPKFQVGLISSDLRTAYPTYDLWKTWSTRGAIADQPPDEPPCP